MYNDEFKQYHYQRDDLPRDDYRPGYTGPAYTYTAPEEPKKKGGKKILRTVALLLAVALIAGAAGFGGAAIYRATNRSTATVQLSDRPITQVAVKEVTGQTLMTPAEVYAATVNSVVSINTTANAGYNVFGQPTESTSSGTGFIVTTDGYIVTNAHVVAGASTVKVTLYNGDSYDAKVIGSEEDYDVAVIKIEGTDLPAVVLGKSADVNVGDSVLAIGNPLGELTFSMSQGIVSSCDRAINVDGTPFNMIQVDASINPGNSGGPLMNLYGEVVGIVSAKYSSYSSTVVEGLGFALPISDVQATITDIMENGAVTNKAYLAITAGTMTEEMAAQYNIDKTYGVFVYSVEKGGAGDRAGLRLGDVIVKMGDAEIRDYNDLTAAKKNYRAGDTVTLTVYRDGAETTTELTFDAQPEEAAQQPVQQQPQQQYPNQYPQYPGNNMYDLWDFFFGNRW